MGKSEELFQDEDGYLWIGTGSGLYKFDGEEMVPFTHNKNNPASISGDNINAIGQEKNGKIWVGVSGGGLNILSFKQDSFYKMCLPLDSTCSNNISVNAFAKKSETEMWVGTSEGLYLVQTGNVPYVIKRYTSHPEKGNLSHSYITKLKIDSTDQLWVGTLKGINLYRPSFDDFINFQINPNYPSHPILDIDVDREGLLYISTRFSEARLFYFDNNSGGFLVDSTLVGRKHGEFKISFDLDNNMWISARSRGAYFIHALTKETQFFSRKNESLFGFSNFFGLHTICDDFGNIWMAGEYLLMLPNSGIKIRHFTNSNGKIHAIYRSRNHLWYSGNSPHKLHLIDFKKSEFLPSHIPKNIRAKNFTPNQYQRVTRILPYRKDKLVFCFFRNIVIWDIQNDQYIEYPHDLGGPFKDIGIIKGTSKIWICNNMGAPFILDLKSGVTEKPHYTKSIKRPNRVVRDSLGNYWFSTVSMGIFKLDSSKVITRFYHGEENIERQLSQVKGIDLAVGAKNTIWAATNKGIFQIDAQTSRVIPLNSDDPLLQLYTSAIIVDNNDKVWASTKEGIVRYDPVSKKSRLYDQSFGLQNRIYTLRAVHKDFEGALYFGGERGIDIIQPDSLKENLIPPRLHIKKILINDQAYDFQESDMGIPTIELSHIENFIDIELTALHYTAPEAVEIEYNIPELDNVRRSLQKKRTINLANLAPGTYSILVRASNLSGVFSEMKELVTFQILPPWWKTNWFLTILLGTIALVIWGGIKYRIQNIKKHEHLKTKFNKRIAEIESRALRAQMNPHFLFNSINAVNSLISRDKSEQATIYLKKFSKLIRLVFTNSQKHLIRLKDEIQALQLYLEIEQLRFQNFEFEINIDPNIDQDFVEVPPLILQPYVENAIWHGLLHKIEGNRKVCISIKSNEETLIMTIEDNGIGRQMAQQLKTKGAARKKGLGMQLTRDRLKLLEKINNSKIRTEIKDIKDNDGTPSGTLITILISPPD